MHVETGCSLLWGPIIDTQIDENLIIEEKISDQSGKKYTQVEKVSSLTMDGVAEQLRKQIAALQRVMLLARSIKVDSDPCQIDEVIEFWFLNLCYILLAWFFY